MNRSPVERVVASDPRPVTGDWLFVGSPALAWSLACPAASALQRRFAVLETLAICGWSDLGPRGDPAPRRLRCECLRRICAVACSLAIVFGWRSPLSAVCVVPVGSIICGSSRDAAASALWLRSSAPGSACSTLTTRLFRCTSSPVAPCCTASNVPLGDTLVCLLRARVRLVDLGWRRLLYVVFESVAGASRTVRPDPSLRSLRCVGFVVLCSTAWSRAC